MIFYEPSDIDPQPDCSDEPECPDCDSVRFSRELREQRFVFGKGNTETEITCRVPVYKCLSCACEWTGSEAEDARHEAVCKHLKRLAPRQLLALREQNDFSQAEFSRITGFGEASLSRWETGSQIQNVACDRLLRLLAADPFNIHRLKQIADSEGTETPKFKVIAINDALLRKRAGAFQLRRKIG
jgi:putative zinc finger/helix-turn-helix YgiT family protein